MQPEASYTARSTINFFRAVVSLLVFLPIPVALTVSDLGMNVVIPAAVVTFLGLRALLTDTYTVLPDRIRVAGPFGERMIPFDKIDGFQVRTNFSLLDRLSSVQVGASLQSLVNVEGAQTTFSSIPTRIWVQNAREFESAATTALQTWRQGKEG